MESCNGTEGFVKWTVFELEYYLSERGFPIIRNGSCKKQLIELALFASRLGLKPGGALNGNGKQFKIEPRQNLSVPIQESKLDNSHKNKQRGDKTKLSPVVILVDCRDKVPERETTLADSTRDTTDDDDDLQDAFVNHGYNLPQHLKLENGSDPTLNGGSELQFDHKLVGGKDPSSDCKLESANDPFFDCKLKSENHPFSDCKLDSKSDPPYGSKLANGNGPRYVIEMDDGDDPEDPSYNPEFDSGDESSYKPESDSEDDRPKHGKASSLAKNKHFQHVTSMKKKTIEDSEYPGIENGECKLYNVLCSVLIQIAKWLSTRRVIRSNKIIMYRY